MTASKIMIVEDEGLVGLELSHSLQKMGYEVMPVAPCGDTAIEMVHSDQPDLILMDIRLEHGPDGIETAKKIRDDFHIPVIYLTAHSDEATILRAKSSEAFGYLIKPFEERALRAEIEMALTKAARERQFREAYDWSVAVLKHIHEGAVITDVKGNIRYVNKIAEKMIGKSAKDCTGRNLAEVILAVDSISRKPFPFPIFNITVDLQSVVSGVITIVQPDNGEIAAEYSMTPLKNRNENTVGIIILMKEITDKEKIMREIGFEMERSTKYQVDLLPEKGKKIHGIRTDWFFFPSVYGSGDIFNIFPLSCSHVGFYLLDVMGHGFSSSVLATTLYSFLSYDVSRTGMLIRSSAGEPEQEGNGAQEEQAPVILRPKTVMRELAKRFYFQSHDHPFFTLVYGIIDPLSGRGTLARAGHPYPLLVRKTGKVEELRSEGQALGVFPDVNVEELEFDLNPGDRLYLFSDGFEDLVRDAAALPGKNLAGFLEKNSGLALNETSALLETLVKELHPDVFFTDDIAFFALEKE